MDNFHLNDTNLSEKEKIILETAIEVFSKKGYNGSSTNEIAKKAGVAEGTIFRYFKTKKDILRGILIQLLKYLSDSVIIKPIEKIIENPDYSELKVLLKEIIIDRVNLVESKFPMLRVMFTEALYHDDLREAVLENIIYKALNMYEKHHIKMQEAGVISKDLNAITALRCIAGNIFAYILHKHFFGDKFGNLDFEKEIDHTIDIILHGIVKK